MYNKAGVLKSFLPGSVMAGQGVTTSSRRADLDCTSGKKKCSDGGKKPSEQHLRKTTPVSVSGCTGCRDAAAFGTNSA